MENPLDSSPLLGKNPLRRLDQALLGVLARAREEVGATSASLFLRDPELGDCVERMRHPGTTRPLRIPAGEGLVGAVLQRDRVLLWPGDSPDSVGRTILEHRAETILSVPLRLDACPVGVLQFLDASLESQAQAHSFAAARELETLIAESSMAAQLASRAERPLPLELAWEGVVGSSSALSQTLERAARVAGTRVSVLILGETGTGKDLLARAIHASSPRAALPLVKLDCGALPENLIESELFGHERGAFTGAVNARVGVFERAHGGTVFLDEVGELTASAQIRLLRVLEEGLVRRLGSGQERAVDFRLIAATHRDLWSMVDKEQFRSDLLHRIQVVPLTMPPLRERGVEDIRRLVEHFARLHAQRHQRPVLQIPEAAYQLLLRYAWPGNVRELSHAVEAAVVLSPDGVLSRELFTLGGTRAHSAPMLHPYEDSPSLETLIHRYIGWLMERCDGHRAEVARKAGISRSTLWRYLKEMNLDTAPEAPEEELPVIRCRCSGEEVSTRTQLGMRCCLAR